MEQRVTSTKHPKALYVLFLVEMWERFAYYLMVGILFLYLIDDRTTGGKGFSEEIGEQLSTWRHRHMNMVHRMIGTRIGTGGSSGKDYLKAAADKHYIFKDIPQLTSFLIERRRLPQLPKDVERKLGFAVE